MGWVGMSMYWKELKAVHLSLIRFQDQLKGHCIRILSDSSGLHQERGFAGFRVSLGSVKGPASLCPIQGHRSVSSASEEEIEGPSQQGFEGWSHQHRMVLRPWFLWEDLRSLGVPLVDLFATQDNSQLPQFVSQCPDPWALGCDALRVTRVLLVLLKGPKMSLCPFERTFQKDKGFSKEHFKHAYVILRLIVVIIIVHVSIFESINP